MTEIFKMVAMKLLVAVCCLVAVYAQVPQPCASPKQWEGRVFRTEKRSDKGLNEAVKVSYDEENQRIREIDEFTFGKVKEMYEAIYLHKEKKEYRINLVTRKCNVTELTRPFQPYGVPSGAQFDGFVTIGAAGLPNQSLNVQKWEITQGQEKFEGTVTFPDCIPVQYNHYQPPTNFITSTYFDISAGIRDPNVFTPPSECTGLL